MIIANDQLHNKTRFSLTMAYSEWNDNTDSNNLAMFVLKSKCCVTTMERALAFFVEVYTNIQLLVYTNKEI